jgi:uncharacterized protein (DUF1800 family)
MEWKHKHLLNRAAFGAYAGDAESPVPAGFAAMVGTSGQQANINVVSKPVADDLRPGQERQVKLKQFVDKMREAQVSLNVSWMQQMPNPALVLREKMTLFWHDHFACRTRNPYLAQQQNNTIRQHAFGKFSDLLRAVSKDPAMLQFLNNQQNKKDSPNENFARELMELFTLGRGQYSEADIKEAARAFTGWGFDRETGDFIFRKRIHDDGVKRFRNRTGNFTGDNIIDMILDDPATARFITLKVWQFFVHPEVADTDIIHTLSAQFYASGYDITGLLHNIFTASWFYDSRFRGNRIKSPVELIVGMKVHTGGSFNDGRSLLFLQKAMGQVLFQPPNVGGWPNGRQWIDSSSLAFRMSLPSILLRDSQTDFEAKDDGDVNDVTNTFGKTRSISFSADWQKISNAFTRSTTTQTMEAIENHLMALPVSPTNRKMIHDLAGKSHDDPEFTKRIFIAYMSLPDYQLS